MLGGRICQWLLLFQEFDFDVVVKPGKSNVGPNHLSRIQKGETGGNLDDDLPNAHVFRIKKFLDQFTNIVLFLAIGRALLEYTSAQRRQLVTQSSYFQLIGRPDGILRMCVMENEWVIILIEEQEGTICEHNVGNSTVRKVLRVGLWPSLFLGGQGVL